MDQKIKMLLLNATTESKSEIKMSKIKLKLTHLIMTKYQNWIEVKLKW